MPAVPPLQGEAGAGKSRNVWDRFQSLLRGRKAAADEITVDPEVDDKLVGEAAKEMSGFSAREIAKCMASMQAAVYGSAEPRLTRDLFRWGDRGGGQGQNPGGWVGFGIGRQGGGRWQAGENRARWGGGA